MVRVLGSWRRAGRGEGRPFMGKPADYCASGTYPAAGTQLRLLPRAGFVSLMCAKPGLAVSGAKGNRNLSLTFHKSAALCYVHKLGREKDKFLCPCVNDPEKYLSTTGRTVKELLKKV